MLIQEAISQFLENLKLRNLSNNTILLRRDCLRHFADFLHSRNIDNLNQITTDLLYFYVRKIRNKKKSSTLRELSASRKSVYLTSLRLYLNYCYKNKFTAENLGKHIEIPKVPKMLPKDILTVNEVKKLLQKPDILNSYGLRDRAMMEVFYSTGIRSSELACLKIYDIVFEKEVLIVRRGKGNKDRVVPIGKKALHWVNEYLNKSRQNFAKSGGSDFLFLKDNGKNFTNLYLSSLVRFYLNKSRLRKQGGCHLFRHSMATHMLKNGCDIRFIQEILGHVELSTTQNYTRVNIEDLQRVYERSFN